MAAALQTSGGLRPVVLEAIRAWMAYRGAAMVALRVLLLFAFMFAAAGPMEAAMAADKVSILQLDPELRKIARAYFLHDPYWKKIMTEQRLGPDMIDVMGGAALDMDGDGQKEVFLQLNEAWAMCGSAVGCPVIVIKKDGKHWHLMGEFNTLGYSFVVLERKDHGVRRIVAHELTEEAEVTYKWDPSIRNGRDPTRLGDFVETDDN